MPLQSPVSTSMVQDPTTTSELPVNQTRRPVSPFLQPSHHALRPATKASGVRLGHEALLSDPIPWRVRAVRGMLVAGALDGTSEWREGSRLSMLPR